MNNLLSAILRIQRFALAGVAQWIERRPANGKIASSIPCQGICLSCGPSPQLGVCKRQLIEYISCTLMFPSLSFSLPSTLSENK